MDSLSQKLKRKKQGLLILGHLPSTINKEAVVEFANSLGWPVFADIASGLRSKSILSNAITYFDQVLLSEKIKKSIKPELILQIGAPLTSKRLLQFLSKDPPDNYIQILNNSQRSDPDHIVSEKYIGDISHICSKLNAELNSVVQKYKNGLLDLDKKVNRELQSVCHPDSSVTEISVAKYISENLPENHALFLGNSMPIRDFDMFADFKNSSVHVGTNRGASGIDGTIASATGFASGYEMTVTIVLGDLAAMHDLNSLDLIKKIKMPVILLIINNKGGGIFSFLPIAQYSNIFEKYFATPHDVTFKAAAELFNMKYEAPETNRELVNTYKKYLSDNRSVIIEILTDRDNNLSLHKDLQKKIITKLD